MFNLFKKTEKKSAQGYCQQEIDTIFDYQTRYSEAIRFFVNAYYEVAPVGIAVDMIAQEIAHLSITAEDSTGEFNNNVEILKKLRTPNKDQSLRSFIDEIMVHYILLGNVFIDFNKIGSSYEMLVLSQQNITIAGIQANGKATTIIYSGSNDNLIYREYNYNDKTNQYETKQGNILLHLKNNNITTIDKQMGVSFLMKGQLEISQYKSLSEYNNGLIKNQCRPSLGFFFEVDKMSNAQIEDIKETMKAISGSTKAGKPFAITAKARVEKFSESTKDMDFENLKKSTKNIIAQCLKIPLPLLNDTTMTYSNYSTAQYAFFDNCVLPFAQVMIDFFNNKILPLLGESKYKLAIDKTTIGALEERKLATVKSHAEAGVFTINEIRAIGGKESVENGDIIYQPQNLVPVGTDRYTQDNRETPSEKAFFIALMKEQGYNDNEIKELAKKYF
ncbi:COG4695 Phage-related protein [uncultured Caudovirales phage]|uniref:COG4695 Phage-related protein n=1 Tax=uncultured Caudovirales phage TaxID=2100421 RepID=A0A6J5LMY9_9CAUD|nr:COG4695 Phage-related protein [uncultured Caudovirales phage]